MDWKLQPHIFSHSAQTTFMHTHETGSDFFEAAYPILRTLLVLPAGGVCLQSAGDRLPRVHPLDHDAHRRYGCGGAVSAPRGSTAENAAAAMPLRSPADHGTGIHRWGGGQSSHGLERLGLQQHAAEPLRTDLPALFGTVVFAVHSRIRHLQHRRKTVPPAGISLPPSIFQSLGKHCIKPA